MHKIIYNNKSDVKVWGWVNYVLNIDTRFKSATNNSQIIHNFFSIDTLVSYYKRENIVAELCFKNNSKHNWKNKDFVISIEGAKYFAKNVGERVEMVNSQTQSFSCTVYQITTITDDEIVKLGIDLEKYQTRCLEGNGTCTIKTVGNPAYKSSDEFIEKLEFGEDLSLEECIEIVKLIYPKMNKYKDFKESFYRHSALDLKKAKALEYMESLKPGDTTTLKNVSNELDIPVNIVDWASCCDKDFRTHFNSYRKHVTVVSYHPYDEKSSEDVNGFSSNQITK